MRIVIASGAAVAAVAAILAAPARATVTITSFTAETADTLAGGHEDATTAFTFRPLGIDVDGGTPLVVTVNTPPGLIADAQNVPPCPRSQFELSAVLHGGCPATSQVGLAHVRFGPLGEPETLGVYNVTPGPNEAALLGIQGLVASYPVSIPIVVSATAANGYAVTATTSLQYFPVGFKIFSGGVTLWGVPGAHTRGVGDTNFNISSGTVLPAPRSEWQPFMQNPTDCAALPITRLLVNTAEEPESFAEAVAMSPTPTACSSVPFAPSIKAEPDTTRAGAPAAIEFDLALPQSDTPEGRGTAELEKAVVTLPAGMTVSPSAASKGLEACTDEQFGASSDTSASCPPGSVIGEDEVESPLVLSAPLKGKVYLGQPLSIDPTSGQMFRVFQELRGFGLDIKLHGSVTADPNTGQLTATFANLPELPFEDFKMRLNGGSNAVLVNSPTCDLHTTTTQLFPYSNPTTPATPSSTFTTSYDGNGGQCPAALPFGPSSSISTASNQAGALSPLTVTFARADETQPLGQIDTTLPKGLLGYVSKVQLCEAAQAVAGTCSPESRIGTVSTTAGAGPDPLTVGGSVYLAHGSNGYPFMLSVVVPAIAGPYDLGNVVVPVWLQVNSDGSITAISGPMPSILDGIPIDIRSVTMNIGRPGFTFNPTSCMPLSMSGQVTSLAGAVALIAAPFEVTGCGSLPFKPSFTVATTGATSRANGASLTVRVAQKPGEADIHSVHVELPRQLSSRLSTLQKACTEAQFVSNPAGCPRGSVVGMVTAISPTLSVPLVGPAVLVSHGGAAFPDLEVLLQGEGITVMLDGSTDIKRGVTSSTFASVPDVPISGFELTLSQGPYSLLSVIGPLCTSKLSMPTTIAGWNDVLVKQRTRIAISGCAKPKLNNKAAKKRSKRASDVRTSRYGRGRQS